MIVEARQDVARTVNSALVRLYWQIGQRIRLDILRERRAGYGERIVYALSAQLAAEFGSGFSEKSLRRMIQFAEEFPKEQIVATASRQLGWSHFIEIGVWDRGRTDRDLLDWSGSGSQCSKIAEIGAYINRVVAWSANAGAGIQILELPG